MSLIPFLSGLIFVTVELKLKLNYSFYPTFVDTESSTRTKTSTTFMEFNIYILYTLISEYVTRQIVNSRRDYLNSIMEK